MKGGGTHQRIVCGIAAETGQAVAEYAALLALVAAVAFVGYQQLAAIVVALYQQVVTAFTQ